MSYLLIGIGGIFGSLTRYILGKKISENSKSSIPIGTLLINITGALLLGVVAALELNNTYYLILAEGFLGAYTTFSTFMFEGFQLFQKNEKANAMIYILTSLILGLLGFLAGFEAIRFFI